MKDKKNKEKLIKNIKAEDSSNLDIFEELGFSAFENSSLKHEEMVDLDTGFIVEKEVKKDKKYRSTKRISRKEAINFNKKYVENVRRQQKARKKNKKIKIFPIFQKNKKNDIIKNEIKKEIKKEKKKIFKLESKEKLKLLIKKIKKDLKENKEKIKKETSDNLKKIRILVKKRVNVFFIKNIKNKTNRRKNILNLFVFIPIIILLIININLIKNIILTNKSIIELRKLKENSIILEKESDELEIEIKRLKKELEN